MRGILLATALLGVGCHKVVVAPAQPAVEPAPRVLIQRAALPDGDSGSDRPRVIVGPQSVVLAQGSTASLWRRPGQPGERPVKIAEHISDRLIDSAALTTDGRTAAITTGAGVIVFDADGGERRYPLDLARDNAWPMFVGDRLLVATPTTLYEPAAGLQVRLPEEAIGAPPPTTTAGALHEADGWTTWRATGRPPDGVGVVRRTLEAVVGCGDQLALGYDDGTVDLWRGLERTGSLTSASHAGRSRFIEAVAWSPDCSAVHALVRVPEPRLLTWSAAGDASAPTEAPLPAALASALEPVLTPASVEITGDGHARLERTVWSRQADGTWMPPRTRAGGGVTALGPAGAVAHVEGDGSLEVDGGRVEGSVRWWHVVVEGTDAALSTYDAVHIVRPDGGARIAVPGVRAIALARGKLYVADVTPSLRVYDARTGAAEGGFPLERMVGEIAVSPTRDFIALAGSSTGFWVREGDAVEAVDFFGTEPIRVLRWSADGERLALGGSHGGVWIMDVAARQLTKVGDFGRLVLDLVWADGLVAVLDQAPARRLPPGATDGVWVELDWQALSADSSLDHGLARVDGRHAIHLAAGTLPGDARARRVRWTSDGRLCWAGDTAGCFAPSGAGVRLVGDAADTRVDERGRVTGDPAAVLVQKRGTSVGTSSGE